MTADGQRIADLEQQVADLTEQVERLARRALIIKALSEIAADAGPGEFTLRTVFEAGRASAREGTMPRAASRHPRHLHAVEARHA